VSQPILDIQALTKSYRSGPLAPVREVLTGVDLQVMPGEVLSFFGVNGAGKSTTNKIILGLVRPTSGECRIGGRPAGDHQARVAIGYLPENPSYYEFLTGEELLWYAARLFGLPAPVAGRRIAALLSRVGLAADSGRRIGEYSKGMRQRLGLAQALVNEPDLLILDEPFEGLDPLGRQMLKTAILSERSRGAAVFLSSHQLLDAEGLCDRAAILHRGRVVESGTVAELRASRPGLNLEQIFLGAVGGGPPVACQTGAPA
jgi:ABC-2 type transport system ATP-binding protein